MSTYSTGIGSGSYTVRWSPSTESSVCCFMTNTGRVRSAPTWIGCPAAGVNLAFFSLQRSLLEDPLGTKYRLHHYAVTNTSLHKKRQQIASSIPLTSEYRETKIRSGRV